MGEGSTADFYVLPEGCISSILSLTSPRDACRSALVSWMFRSAADSDSVWERFLPADYQEIISRSVSPLAFSSKKELYFHLCDNHFLIDDGNKSFTLDKWSGKKCYMMGARELSIVWGDTPAYWSWKPLPESRFSEVAELVSVCWLEINCNVKTRMLSPNTVYVAYLVLKFTETAYGFQFPPAEVSVRFGGGEAVQTAYLDPVGSQRLQLRMQGRPGIFRSRFGFGFGLRPQVSRSGPISEGQVPQEREDGWMEIEMGEFFNDRGEDGEVEMSLREVNGGNWKGGLIIQGIEIRAKRE